MPLLRRVVAAACAAVAVLVPVTPSASATVVSGNDYSWPQCPRGVGDGQGQPLPTGSRTFAIVGLTNGQGLHENPCLALMWAYARKHAGFVSGYTMVTYPTATERSAARVGHYGHCTTLACELRNHGWSQGVFTAKSLAKVGAHPPLVWVDVETRIHQPWSSSRSNNALVIKAEIASLQAAGYRVGVYSNRYLWTTIAGFRTSLPEWVPAGSLSRGCGWSFAGGHVLLSQWSHTYSNGASYDENGRCANPPATATWWQQSHPVVTSSRNSTTSGLYARFGTSPAFSLAGTSRQAAAVVAASSPGGSVPLFVATISTGALRARTLATSWRAIGSARCSTPPAATVSGRVLTVHCIDLTGVAVVTTATVDSYGGPVSAGSSTAPSTAAAPTRMTSTLLR